MQTIASDGRGLGILTRAVSPNLSECELTFISRSPISYRRAAQQHRRYIETLRHLGVDVITLPPLPHLPDSVFVEDIALILDEVAVITSPCPARRSETDRLRPILEQYRPVVALGPGVKLEGGDVVQSGRKLYVGVSTRTDHRGIEALGSVVIHQGYELIEVEVDRCLHLSTAVSCLGDDTFLLNPRWVDAKAFAGNRVLEICEQEPWAANVLRLGKSVLLPDGFPRTCDLLEQAGYSPLPVNIDELLKAEAGITCMGLLFNLSPQDRKTSMDECDTVGTRRHA
jgi:dimethylargininase